MRLGRAEFTECFHCQKSLDDIDQSQWWKGYCGEACARSNLPASGRVIQALHAQLVSDVLGVIHELGDDVGFDVIAEKAGCTAEQAYTIYLNRCMRGL